MMDRFLSIRNDQGEDFATLCGAMINVISNEFTLLENKLIIEESDHEERTEKIKNAAISRDS